MRESFDQISLHYLPGAEGYEIKATIEPKQKYCYLFINTLACILKDHFDILFSQLLIRRSHISYLYDQDTAPIFRGSNNFGLSSFSRNIWTWILSIHLLKTLSHYSESSSVVFELQTWSFLHLTLN